MKTKTTPWTKEEDVLLAASIQENISLLRFSVRLHRSEAGIRRRMRELGLKGRKRRSLLPPSEIVGRAFWFPRN